MGKQEIEALAQKILQESHEFDLGMPVNYSNNQVIDLMVRMYEKCQSDKKEADLSKINLALMHDMANQSTALLTRINQYSEWLKNNADAFNKAKIQCSYPYVVLEYLKSIHKKQKSILDEYYISIKNLTPSWDKNIFAVGFAEWIRVNEWLHDTSKTGHSFWYKASNGKEFQITDLLQLYKESLLHN